MTPPDEPGWPPDETPLRGRRGKPPFSQPLTTTDSDPMIIHDARHARKILAAIRELESIEREIINDLKNNFDVDIDELIDVQDNIEFLEDQLQTSVW